jgi:hypothetical protein
MSEIPESSVTYEELADLERDFDDAEAEISAFSLVPKTNCLRVFLVFEVFLIALRGEIPVVASPPLFFLGYRFLSRTPVHHENPPKSYKTEVERKKNKKKADKP